MSDEVEPTHPEIDERSEGEPSSRPHRKSPSTLVLAVLSVLNFAALAMLIHHFASSPDGPAPAAIRQVASHDMQLAPVPSAPPPSPEPSAQPPMDRISQNGDITRAAGNVDLAPAARHVLLIAAGIADPPDRSPVKLQPDETDDTEETAAVVPPSSAHSPGHWVQLGALSKTATASRYWSSLKRSHATLLRDRTPRIFGPDDVGGSLYHLRIGPMADEAAASLCMKLAAEGADCFCVAPSAERS